MSLLDTLFTKSDPSYESRFNVMFHITAGISYQLNLTPFCIQCIGQFHFRDGLVCLCVMYSSQSGQYTLPDWGTSLKCKEMVDCNV